MTTRILEPTPENLEIVAQALRAGDLAAIPTETVYGLAGDGLNEAALTKIFQAKERPTFDPLILHLPSKWRDDFLERGLVDLDRLGSSARNQVRSLAAAFWPGPLTLVLPKLPVVPDLATSGLDSVALRIPSHPVAQEILNLVDRPLAAPSANRFGRISPTEASHVLRELHGRIPWIVNGGQCEIGVESTVIRVIDGSTAVLLRPGKIGSKDIESAGGLKIIAPADLGPSSALADSESFTQHSPGLLASHYAPNKRLILLDRHASEFTERILMNPGAAVLFFNRRSCEDFHKAALGSTHQLTAERTLSPEGDLETAARNLFRYLRELDESDADLLYAEPAPEGPGLGHAIMDRLSRASAR